MKRLWTSILVIPALLLLTTSEANAQRRGGFGVSVGTGGFSNPGIGIGYNPGFGGYNGYGGYNGFGGTPGFGYGNGYGAYNRGFNGAGYGGYGYSPFNGFGRGTGVGVTFGGSGYGSGYSNNGSYYSNSNNYGNYSPRYDSNGYTNPTYSTTTMPVNSSSFYQPTTHGTVTPIYSSESGMVQTGYNQPSNFNNGIMTLGGTIASSTPGVAKIKMTVPNDAELWIDGKKIDGSGTSREFSSETISSMTNVKLKIKNGEMTREFTMPIRPGENSTFDVNQLLR